MNNNYAWRRGIERRNVIGERIVVDELIGPGGHAMERRFVRKLTDGEVWPPPAKPDPAIVAAKSSAAKAEAERAAQVGDIRAYLLGPESHLCEAEKAEIQRELEWRRKVGS